MLLRRTRRWSDNPVTNGLVVLREDFLVPLTHLQIVKWGLEDGLESPRQSLRPAGPSQVIADERRQSPQT